ncbi:hypothetical protein D3C71_1775050 [compost metagenome]
MNLGAELLHEVVDVVSPPIGYRCYALGVISFICAVVRKRRGRIEVIVQMNAVNIVTLHHFKNRIDYALPGFGNSGIDIVFIIRLHDPFGMRLDDMA